MVDVLRNWFGVEVELLNDHTQPEKIRVEWGGREVSSWNRHALGEERTSIEIEVGWILWKQNGQGSCSIWLPCAVSREDEGLPMDPLAATFWALTCWSERNNQLSRDEHGRPVASEMPWSHHRGLVSFGERQLKATLQHRWPWLELMWHGLFQSWGLPEAKLGLTFQPTVDVDVAFKHLGRSRVKHVGLQIRDAMLGKWSDVKTRSRVMRGLQSDPYDTYGFLHDVHREEALWWFVLAADRRRPFDVGLNPNSDVLPSLVESLSSHGAGAKVCWHPGYRAMEDAETCQCERERIQSWHGINTELVRAHFLRSEPARDWPLWESMGIQQEASLGWARDVGFRAGASRAFPAYDVEGERPLSLTVHPLAVMDSALKYGLNWSPKEAAEEMDEIMAVVAQVGGTWMSCWHNTSVSEVDGWQGWRATYLHMVQSARSLG